MKIRKEHKTKKGKLLGELKLMSIEEDNVCATDVMTATFVSSRQSLQRERILWALSPLWWLLARLIIYT